MKDGRPGQRKHGGLGLNTRGRVRRCDSSLSQTSRRGSHFHIAVTLYDASASCCADDQRDFFTSGLEYVTVYLQSHLSRHTNKTIWIRLIMSRTKCNAM